jgi:hypothetical protein
MSTDQGLFDIVNIMVETEPTMLFYTVALVSLLWITSKFLDI